MTGEPEVRPAVTSLLTAEQLAQRWQVPKSHVYRLAREYGMPCVRLGRYVRFKLDAVEAFENAQAARYDEK